jgi:hypothetical protein
LLTGNGVPLSGVSGPHPNGVIWRSSALGTDSHDHLIEPEHLLHLAMTNSSNGLAERLVG